MKKIGLCLVALMTVSLLISGCQAAKIEETPLKPSLPETTDEEHTLSEIDDTTGDSDQEVFAKLFHFIDLSSKQVAPIQLEYSALVKSVSINGSTLTISFDKIELTNNNDPQGEFYTNKDELNESIDTKENIIILVDPHNSFEAITVDGLKNLLVDGDIPFYFYSINNEISFLAEMMLP